MMKKIILNILAYIFALVLFNGPLLFFDYFSPLYLMWIAPIFLIYINVFLTKMQKSKICIWRIIPTSAIITIGYIIENCFIDWYYMKTTGDLPYPFTYLLADYFYTGSFIVVLISICIYQIWNVFTYIYLKHKNDD